MICAVSAVLILLLASCSSEKNTGIGKAVAIVPGKTAPLITFVPEESPEPEAEASELDDDALETPPGHI